MANKKNAKMNVFSLIMQNKFLALFIVLILVIAINHVVFSYLLQNREKAKAFSSTFGTQFFSYPAGFTGATITAGTNMQLLADLWLPIGATNDNLGCSWQLGANPCMTIVDADGAFSLATGIDDDGAGGSPFNLVPYGGNYLQIFFRWNDWYCANNCLNPTELYKDGSGDCNPLTPGPDVIFLDTDGVPGLSAASYTNIGLGGGMCGWLHSELVNSNGLWDYCDPAVPASCLPNPTKATETVWTNELEGDNILVQGSDWDNPILNQWQGDTPSVAWSAQDTFFDASLDGKFNGSPSEPVYFDSDKDGLYTDFANLTYDADGTGSLGTGVNDDIIPDGATLTPLVYADGICINTLGQGGVGNVIIYGDGNNNCIPNDGGTDQLFRDDVGWTTFPVVPAGPAVFPYTFINAAYILYYYDGAVGPPNLGWDGGPNAASTETLWAKMSGLNRWHTNIEGATGPIEADGTFSTLGSGANDDPLVNGAPLTFLKAADNVCFSRHPVTTGIEDIYVDLTNDCFPFNDPGCGVGPGACMHPNLLQDNSGDGLNPASVYGGILGPLPLWSSGAGIFAYLDYLPPFNSWNWSPGPPGTPPGPPLTETLWIEASGNTFASAADLNVYGYGSAPLAGDILTQLSTATGSDGFNLIYADADNSGALNSTDTILEDNGNVQTGLVVAPNGNGVIDRQEDILQHITIKNVGDAVAGSDISSLDLYYGGPGADGCDNPINSVNDSFVATLTAITGSKTWEYNGVFGPSALNGRLCVSANINPAATGGRTIALEIPQLADTGATPGLFDPGTPVEEGIFYYSGNDGAVGGNFDLPYIFTITVLPSYGSLSQDTTPPALVTNIKIIADSTGRVTLTWKDPADPDLAKIVIDETLDGQTNTNTVNAGIQILVLENRVVGKTYAYKLRSQDTSGNLSPASVFSITIPASGQTEVTQPEAILPTPLPIGGLPVSVKVGDIVKNPVIPAVYYIGSDNKKHNFPNEIIYKTWYDSFSSLKIISAADLESIISGNDVYIREGTYLVKKSADPKCYAIEPGGSLRWIENETIAKALYGSNWTNRLIDLSEASFSQYTLGNNISNNTHPTGSLFGYSGSIKIYYIENGQKREVSSGVFIQNRFQDRFVSKNIASSITYADGLVMAGETAVGYFPEK